MPSTPMAVAVQMDETTLLCRTDIQGVALESEFFLSRGCHISSATRRGTALLRNLVLVVLQLGPGLALGSLQTLPIVTRPLRLPSMCT
jgi:hypothetical protein